MSGEAKGTLYLCATPIGNLEDITLRVLRILREVDLIAAEDTRHTRKLLSYYRLSTPLTSYHQHNRGQKGEHLLRLLLSGKQIALVSDAGMPGISDPGADLAAQAIASGIPVVPLPGASAAVTALVVSGLPCATFVFEGFLPATGKNRRSKLVRLAQENRTMIFYESPYRLLETLADLLAIFGNRRIAVARELTKQHEEVVRGTVQELLEYFRGHILRGEFTLVVAGRANDVPDTVCYPEKSPAEIVAFLEASGMDRRQALREAARQCGLPKREIYKVMIREKEGEK